MPDSTSLPVAEGGRSSKGGGVSMPLIIGGGVAFLVLLFFLNKQSSGGGPATATTAAGTSINAALGSIQEQNMNILGAVGASEARIASELGGVNANVIIANAATQHGLQGVTANINALASEQGLPEIVHQGPLTPTVPFVNPNPLDTSSWDSLLAYLQG